MNVIDSTRLINNKRIFFNTRILLLGLISFQISVAHSNTDAKIIGKSYCYDNLRIFLKRSEKKKTKLTDKFSLSVKDHGLFKKILYKMRDKVRHRLQIWNGHPYPVVAIDDTPFAMGWAKHALGKLSDEQQVNLDIPQRWIEINTYLALVKGYQAEIERLTREVVNNTIQIQAVERVLKEHDLPSFGIEVEIPQFVLNNKGEEVLQQTKFYYGTRAQLEIDLRELKIYDRALSKEARDRALSQALSSKKLETYRHELIRQKTAFPEIDLPSDYKAFLREVNTLFADYSKGVLKDEFRPPSWAFEKLRWKQVGEEFKSIYVRQMPSVKSQEKLNSILKFISELSEDEIRALGLQDMANSVEIYKRTRWGRVAAAGGLLVGVPSGAGFSWRQFHQYIYRDSIAKEKCVSMFEEKEYLECAAAYLKDKFPGRFFVDSNKLHDLLDDFGEIADVEIKSEIDDIRDRRVKYLYGKNMQNGISTPAKNHLQQFDPSSTAFRVKLISILDDEQFKKELMNRDPQKGYLQFKYGLAFSKDHIRSQVELILSTKDQQLRRVYLNQLKKITIAEELVLDLEALLNERAAYKAQHEEEERVLHSLGADFNTIKNADAQDSH